MAALVLDRCFKTKINREGDEVTCTSTVACFSWDGPYKVMSQHAFHLKVLWKFGIGTELDKCFVALHIAFHFCWFCCFFLTLFCENCKKSFQLAKSVWSKVCAYNGLPHLFNPLPGIEACFLIIIMCHTYIQADASTTKLIPLKAHSDHLQFLV